MELIDKLFDDAVSGIKEDWFTFKNNSWYDYVMNLEPSLKIVYLIEIFDAQIFNGGFEQYFTNRYGIFSQETIIALQSVRAFRKADLLKRALSIVKSDDDTEETFREKLVTSNHEIFRGNSFSYLLNDLDNEYYNSYEDENLRKLLIDFFSNEAF